MSPVLDRPTSSLKTKMRSSNEPRLPKLPKDKPIKDGPGFLRRFFIASSLFCLLMIVAVVIAVWSAWITTPLPPDVPLAQTTTVTDANGKQLATFNAGQNRVPVKLGDVPPVVIQAITDTEDHSYYQHHGVDPRGTARALWVDIRSGKGEQGGSTITQQYVKQTYVGTDHTLWRKFKEAILAVKLSQRESKDEVLERYVNTIYWGRGAYGIQTASHAYFNKDVQQLGLQEASYLAGLIRGPELADAYKDPQNAQDRRALTLASMVKYGHITPQQEQTVSATPLKSYVVAKAPVTSAATSSAKGADYFVTYVKDVLIKKYGEQLVDTGGLKVKTTLDANLQSQAYDSIYGFLKPGEPSGALVSIDSNGYIKAMVGGRDYKTSQVNLALGADGGGSGRQAGSTFKAFELASAVDNGDCYWDTYRGSSPMTIPGWDQDNKPVTNFGGESFGRINLIDATVNSVNTVYAQMVMDNTPQALVSEAQKAGITSNLDPNPSLVLGVDSVSPLEMADAYLTFSQEGVHVAPNPILEVKNANNETLEKAAPKRDRVIDAKTADVVNYALQQVVQRGTGTAARTGVSSKVALAGKTGTTEDNGDAWFVGYTPSLSTAVWMGFPDGSSHQMSNVRGIAVTGGTFPAQMFSTYMRVATSGQQSSFAAPPTCSPRGTGTTTTTDPDSDTGNGPTTSLFSTTTVPSQTTNRGRGNGNATGTTDSNGLQDLNNRQALREGRRVGNTTATSDFTDQTVDPNGEAASPPGTTTG